jgi:hypothetical protein
MLYLISLQQLTEFPFRVVDEINQVRQPLTDLFDAMYVMGMQLLTLGRTGHGSAKRAQNIRRDCAGGVAPKLPAVFCRDTEALDGPGV